jgi:hypothetical protein
LRKAYRVAKEPFALFFGTPEFEQRRVERETGDYRGRVEPLEGATMVYRFAV